MIRDTESDVTYCSDVEKGAPQQQIRRSERISQRSFHSSFRSSEETNFQRLCTIYQTLKCGTSYSNWLEEDWLALQVEVDLIKKLLKRKKANYRISFVSKKIDEHLKQSNQINQSGEEPLQCRNAEPVKSPNVLAGMMSEALTEIPPYQPQHLSNMIKPTMITQKSPLDLTKKPGGFSEEDNSERIITSLNTPTAADAFREEQRVRTPLSAVTNVSNVPVIDLVAEEGIEENIARPKTPVHVSKWLKYLPTQERQTIIERPTTSINRNKPKLKDSIKKLYKDKLSATESTASNTPKSSINSGSKQIINSKKSNIPQNPNRSNEHLKQKVFSNTENMFTRKPEIYRRSPQNVQSEHFCEHSPDFLLNELLGPNEHENESEASLSLSMKEDFKKVFGTDSFREIFGCHEVTYNLKRRHIKRLAKALNLESKILTKMIEQILSEDNCEMVEDDATPSDSSVIECSQSPTQRLFPSQRSQISK